MAGSYGGTGNIFGTKKVRVRLESRGRLYRTASSRPRTRQEDALRTCQDALRTRQDAPCANRWFSCKPGKKLARESLHIQILYIS